MKLIRGLHNLRAQRMTCVATIGNFDGVHLGHQAILQRLQYRSFELEVPSCVIVFEPQPREFFAPNEAPARLTCLRDKLQLLEEQGVDFVLCLHFNESLRQLTAMEFVQQVLIDGLNVRYLEVGDDFRFGCDRSGDFSFLRSVSEQKNFVVEASKTAKFLGERISSTGIRKVLSAADFLTAKNMLGRSYQLSGRVVSGRQLGRQIGIPTANIKLKENSSPLSGVYIVSAEIVGTGSQLTGIANIGYRPSVAADKNLMLEVHFLHFSEDIYNERLNVTFRHKVREEQRFSSLEELKNAINTDISAANTYWQKQLILHEEL